MLRVSVKEAPNEKKKQLGVLDSSDHGQDAVVHSPVLGLRGELAAVVQFLFLQKSGQKNHQ